ncbi:MAG: methionine--tRNA ligase [Ardenticatenaceae bacterium]|nr:methionine--tRNA ligase [Ardenticatenaceae bacterium]
MTKPILIAVAWPYANGDLHLGHLAGAFLPADIVARYHRLRGNRVLMVSGSDAHGTPITIAADKEGIPPRQLFTRYHERFLQSLRALGISFDLFTHTDTANHVRIAQDFFLGLYEKGYIFPQKQTLLYSESEGRFLPDRYVEGTCPVCGYAEARGDQCDECGSLLDGVDLIEPRSVTDGTRPFVRETEHLFLDLPALRHELMDFVEERGERWRTAVLNFTRRYIEEIRARPITRDLDWGIPVPVPGWEEKKVYIWFENIIGYFSASVEWAKNQGEPEAWRAWWYEPTAQSYYFLGKDNIPFHTVLWPAELMGLGQIYGDGANTPLNLPYDVPASEYLTIEQRQFSKSRHWAVWLPDLLERYEADAVRYVVAAMLPENRDTDFSWAEFVRRNNTELVAAWGNLVQRVLSFAYKQWGCVPPPGELRPFDHTLLQQIRQGFDTVGELLAAVKLRAALQEAFTLVRAVNAYLDLSPWFGVVKVDEVAAATTVYVALQAIDWLKVLLSPFLPHSAEELHRLLGYEDHLGGSLQIVTFAEEAQVHEAQAQVHEALVYEAEGGNGRWQPTVLPIKQKLLKPHPLYRKLDEAIIEAELARLYNG